MLVFINLISTTLAVYLLQYRSVETPDTRKESVNTAHSVCGARFAFIGTLVATLSQINIPIVNTRTSLPL